MRYFLTVFAAFVAVLVLAADTNNGLKPEVRGCRLEKEVLKLDLIDGANEVKELVAQEYNSTNKIHTREDGSPGIDATLRYIESKISALREFYNVLYHYFYVPQWSSTAHVVTLDNGDIINSTVFKFSPARRSYSKIAIVSGFGCSSRDYPKSSSLMTYIVKRGRCSYFEKSQAAYESGASSLLMYDDDALDPSTPLTGSLGTPHLMLVPVFGISANDANSIISIIPRKTMYVATTVETKFTNILSMNVIATSKSGNKDNMVMVGTNYDSPSGSPGVNDNLSGTISLLAIAKYLTKFDLHNAVKLVWWSGTNNGISGSLPYVIYDVEDLRGVRAYVEMRALSSSNYGYLLSEFSPISDHFASYFKSKKIPYSLVDFGYNSDNSLNDLWLFDYVGIPSGGVTAGTTLLKDAKAVEKYGGLVNAPYDPCNKLACDDLSNINLDVWYNMTKAHSYIIGNYSNSVEYQPPQSNNINLLSLDSIIAFPDTY